MNGSIYLAASGAILQQTKLDILANNMANINTTGYKEDLSIFRLSDDEANSTPKNTGTNNSYRQRIQPYTPPFGLRTNFSSGSIKPTGNSLDMALNGDGFFVVQTAGGVGYTRQGNFSLNEDGVLVTQNGESVMGQAGEINLEGSRITIGLDGTIEVDGEIVDQIRVVKFEDMSQLKKNGNTMFKPAEGFGAEIEIEAENTTINQGYLELSNVNAIRAMTDIIEAIRVSQAYQKVIQTNDDANAKTVNEILNI
ncbi:MAG: flagellar basal-body rod protein FlgF [Desulfobacteraceae bacterium]|jgi:flagellar basal-body rod protein FlgG